MGHRSSVHPALSLLVIGVVGSVVGFGVHVWLEPWTSAVAIAIGSFAGVVVSHATHQDIVWGFALGAIIAMFGLGFRALGSIFKQLREPTTGPRWFAR
jgi:hypothetical protein